MSLSPMQTRSLVQLCGRQAPLWRAWLNVTERLFAIGAESPTRSTGIADLRKNDVIPGSPRRADEDIHIWSVSPRGYLLATRDSWCVPAIIRRSFAHLQITGGDRMRCVEDSVRYSRPGLQGLVQGHVLSRSKFGKFFGWQIRLGNVFGSKHVCARLTALASYWTKAGRS